jgi:N-methylhydantoinase A
VVINALTERKGVKVGLITTEGFRDTLEIARGNRPDFFNLHYASPAVRAALPAPRTAGTDDLSRATSAKPLDLSALPAILSGFQGRGRRGGGDLLPAFLCQSTHEEAVLAEVERLWPEVSAVSSHQITREWREYERTNTAVLSAYVQPVAARYLGRLDEG